MMQAILRDVDQAAVWIQQAVQNTRVEPVLMFKLVSVWRDVKAVLEDLVQARDALLAQYQTEPVPGGLKFEKSEDRQAYEAGMADLLKAEVNLPHVKVKLPFTLFAESNEKMTDPANRIPFSAEIIDVTGWLIDYPAELFE
jgi:hypothetical protein